MDSYEIVYYGIDESEKVVYVTNIIYTRRDQITALANWHID